MGDVIDHAAAVVVVEVSAVAACVQAASPTGQLAPSGVAACEHLFWPASVPWSL